MIDTVEHEALQDEAGAFGTALLGAAPGRYVAAQYALAHQHLPLQPVTSFDHVLLSLADHGPWALRAADGYARFFAPTSALRRKLTVLVAILESASPSDAAFASSEDSRVSVLVQLLLTGAGFALLLGVGVIVLAPLQLASRFRSDDT